MTWFGGPEYLGIAIWDAGIMLVAATVMVVRRQWRNRHVSHRKLRALAARTVLVAGNMERSHRTVLRAPATGPKLQSGLSRLEQGRRYSVQPQPTPGSHDSGVGPTPPRVRLAGRHEEPQPPAGPVTRDPAGHLPQVDREGVTAAPTRADGDPVRDADTDQLGSVSASPTKRPAAVADPDSAAAADLPTPARGAA
jgi:hypothetical protein